MDVGRIGLLMLVDSGGLSSVIGIEGADGGVNSWVMGHPHSGQDCRVRGTSHPHSGHFVVVIC